jgi:hypothetical protein
MKRSVALSKGVLKWMFRILVIVGVPIFVMVAVVLQTLFAVKITPIEHTEPPEYRTTKTENDRPESVRIKPSEESVDIKIVEEEESSPPKIDLEKIENVKVRAKALFEKGEPFDEFIALLTHEDREVKMAAAKALGEIFPFDTPTFEQKQVFWADVRERELDLKDLLCDALVDTVEKGEHTWLPVHVYSLKNRDANTDKLLAWVSRNHELPDVRMYAMIGIVVASGSDELISQVLNERASDPSIQIRRAVLELRFQRWYYRN